ncbi:DUF3000 domain-containing protein [Jatrophihabitans sp. YIM 134969]
MMTTSEVRTLPTGPRPGEPGTADDPVAAALTPATFSRAVASMGTAVLRPEVRVEPVRPPQRLAPWSHAVAAEVPVGRGGETAATGRLVLLHDPDGHEAWHGTLRLVAFATAELDDAMSIDPMLPEVGWSWLTDALADRDAAFTAAGGTITHTLSSRFGDLAGPATTASIELRASWTALDADLGPHLQAFVDVLAAAAGLPPEGVAVLDAARRRS